MPTLLEDSKSKHDTDFKLNVLVLGMIASVYSAHYPKTPVRGLFSGVSRHSQTIGTYTWSVNVGRNQDREVGVVVTRKSGVFGGEKSEATQWYPWSAFENIDLPGGTPQ